MVSVTLVPSSDVVVDVTVDPVFSVLVIRAPVIVVKSSVVD